MNCSPTLTPEEFKQVHNGLCSLESVVTQLEDILHADLFIKLRKATGDIRRGMQGAYEQDHEASDRKHEMFKAFAETHGLKSTWSVYGVENFGDPRPFKDATTLNYKDHWGEKEATVAIKGNSWGDLYKAADECVKLSGDHHHVFIEGFRQSSINKNILFLITGS